MKKLIIVIVFFVGLSVFAQNRREMKNCLDRNGMEKLSSEQRNLLMSKKMTLELDLNTKQQEQINQIITEQSVKREVLKAKRKARKQNNEKLSVNEIFEMKNKLLDEQIALQNKMKSILSLEQFKDWKSIKEKFQDKKKKVFWKKRINWS